MLVRSAESESNGMGMELTIDQALREGVAAHREGRLQDAERYYNAF